MNEEIKDIYVIICNYDEIFGQSWLSKNNMNMKEAVEFIFEKSSVLQQAKLRKSNFDILHFCKSNTNDSVYIDSSDTNGILIGYPYQDAAAFINELRVRYCTNSTE